MNKKAQASMIGFVLLVVAFFSMIALFAIIDPFKEALDNTRQSSSLNCPGTPLFNQTDYDDDSDFERLVKRPTCFVTGISLVWYVFAVLFALSVWVVSNFRRYRKR